MLYKNAYRIGLYLGLAVSVFNLILACLTGLVFIAVKKENKIPFGPAIGMATFVSLIYGERIIAWYMGLL